MPRLPRLALLLCLGAAHASADTCTRLWSKLARLGCARDRLRDRVHSLPLPDGNSVPLRCSDDFSLCTHADLDVPANMSTLSDHAFPARSGTARPATTTRRRDTPAPPPSGAEPLLIDKTFTEPTGAIVRMLCTGDNRICYLADEEPTTKAALHRENKTG